MLQNKSHRTAFAFYLTFTTPRPTYGYQISKCLYKLFFFSNKSVRKMIYFYIKKSNICHVQSTMYLQSPKLFHPKCYSCKSSSALILVGMISAIYRFMSGTSGTILVSYVIVQRSIIDFNLQKNCFYFIKYRHSKKELKNYKKNRKF